MGTIDDSTQGQVDGYSPGTPFPQNALRASAPPAPNPRRAMIFVLIFGVIFPFVMLLVEFFTRLCASFFFDPIPTIWHMLLFGSIALSNGLILWVQRGRRYRPLLLWGVINGLAIGISSVYTLEFLPILPFAAIGILAFGLGLPGFAPVMALIASIRARKYVNGLTAEMTQQRAPGLWIGITLGVLLLAIAEAPGLITQIGVRMAVDSAPATSQRGIRLIRTAGSRDVLLQHCYQRRQGIISNLAGTLFDSMATVTPAQARVIYYRVTSEPFNLQPPPKSIGRERGRFDEMDFDPDTGGTAVAGRVKDLLLSTSRIDGSVDANAALGYLEWTMTFKNSSTVNREARLQMLLPHDAAVSRLTLWVNGEEREAAFHARGRVRRAYEKVAVVQQRDPVLVTSNGPDRVLVQCFPVPPNGNMKIRLGITVPLTLEKRESAVLALPRIIERNFEIDGTRHAVWMESKQQVRHSDLLQAETTANGVFALRGELPDEALATLLRFTRDATVTSSYTPDTYRPKNGLIVQRFNDATPKPPARIVMVVDASLSMRQAVKEISPCLDDLPPDSDFTVIAAGDMPEAVANIDEITCRGGMDNVPALNKAWDLAAVKPNSAIIWVHGPQPIEQEKVESLLQRWERRPDNPCLYAVEAVSGPNTILQGLDGIRAVKTIPHLGSVREDLRYLFAHWQSDVVRQRSADKPAGSVQTSSHLARLWARDQALDFIAMKGRHNTEAAITIGRQYQLVTPVTGAVVLENARQYKENDLEPVDPGSVPTVPEPATWMLLFVGAMALLGLWWRKRKTACIAMR